MRPSPSERALARERKSSPRNPPVIKRCRHMNDGEDEQKDRERYVDVKPRLQYVLVALLIDEADQQLFSLARDDEQLPDFFLFVFLDEREKVRPVGGSLCAAPHPSEEQPPTGQPARRILANQLVVNALERRRALGRDARHLFRELIELFRDLGGSQIRFDFRQHPRHGYIQNRAENAAGDDDRDKNQRRYGYFVIEPSARVENEDDHCQNAEVNVGLHPLLDGAEGGAIPAFTNPEKGQQETEEESDGAVGEAEARAAVGIFALNVINKTRDQRDKQDEEDSAPDYAG